MRVFIIIKERKKLWITRVATIIYYLFFDLYEYNCDI